LVSFDCCDRADYESFFDGCGDDSNEMLMMTFSERQEMDEFWKEADSIRVAKDLVDGAERVLVQDVLSKN